MDVIIHEVNELPTAGVDPNAWYLFNGEYYFLSNATGAWENKGGDRPERPPVNP